MALRVDGKLEAAHLQGLRWPAQVALGTPLGLGPGGCRQGRDDERGVGLALVADEGGHAADGAVGVNHGGDVAHALLCGQQTGGGGHVAKGVGRAGGAGAWARTALGHECTRQGPGLHGVLGVERKQLGHDAGCAVLQGLGKGRVLGLGAVKEDVDDFEADALLVEGLQQLGHAVAGPGPSAQGLDAFFVDVDDHDAALLGAVVSQGPGAAGQAVVPALQCGGQASLQEHGGQQRQGHGQCAHAPSTEQDARAPGGSMGRGVGVQCHR